MKSFYYLVFDKYGGRALVETFDTLNTSEKHIRCKNMFKVNIMNVHCIMIRAVKDLETYKTYDKAYIQTENLDRFLDLSQEEYKSYYQELKLLNGVITTF